MQKISGERVRKVRSKSDVRYVSNLDTSPQATDLMEQSTMEENYE